MNVTRRQPRYGYVQVLNGVARDYRLSWRARGLLVELLSYPPGYEINIDELVARGREQGKATEGREAMRTAARELKEIGYIVATKYQDESGRWHTALEVTDDPMYDLLDADAARTDAQEPVRRSELGEREFPQVAPTYGKPGVGFSGVNKKTEKKTKKTSSPSPLKDARQSQPSHCEEEEVAATPKGNPAQAAEGTVSPPAPTPTVPQPRPGDHDGDGEHQAAAALVADLPAVAERAGRPLGRRLRTDEVSRLITAITAAFARGWTPAHLRAALSHDLDSARSVVGTWHHRLDHLGDPPPTSTSRTAPPRRRPRDEWMDRL